MSGFCCRLLGEIVEAFKDLGKGQQIDYDDDTDELMKGLKDDVSCLLLNVVNRSGVVWFLVVNYFMSCNVGSQDAGAQQQAGQQEQRA